MPAVSAHATVLVTGANGSIAVWLVRYLLERGYNVRGTVRGEGKAAYLKKQFKSYVDEGKLEFIIVDDNVKPGAFDKAVQGVDAIAHTASPFHLGGGSAEALINPAVKGTVGVLESALKHAGPRLKRVTVLSSIASIAPLLPTREATFNEENWNGDDINEVEQLGDKATPFAKYSASKVLVAAWAFVDEHKHEITWDLVTLCPPMVLGPILHEVSDPPALNTSVKEFYDDVVAQTKTPEQLASFQSPWVDARDVSLAHIRAFEREEVAGRRFILSSGNFVWQDCFDVINALAIPDARAPLGTPDSGKSVLHYFKYDTANARKGLGIQFRGLATTARDTIDSFRERGWLNN